MDRSQMLSGVKQSTLLTWNNTRGTKRSIEMWNMVRYTLVMPLPRRDTISEMQNMARYTLVARLLCRDNAQQYAEYGAIHAGDMSTMVIYGQ